MPASAHSLPSASTCPAAGCPLTFPRYVASNHPLTLTCPTPCSHPSFTYSSYRPYAKRIRELQQANAAEREAAGVRLEDPPHSLPATVPDLDPYADDAFGTVMAWLYSRIPYTR